MGLLLLRVMVDSLHGAGWQPVAKSRTHGQLYNPTASARLARLARLRIDLTDYATQ